MASEFETPRGIAFWRRACRSAFEVNPVPLRREARDASSSARKGPVPNDPVATVAGPLDSAKWPEAATAKSGQPKMGQPKMGQPKMGQPKMGQPKMTNAPGILPHSRSRKRRFGDGRGRFCTNSGADAAVCGTLY